MTTIVIAEDHRLVRQALRALLQGKPEFSVVGEAADGREAIALVEQLRPQVLMVDLMLPEISGLEVIRRVSRLSSETRVLVLSMHSDEGYVVEALKSGALGYVIKDSSSSELVQGLREVSQGRHYLCLALSHIDIHASSQRSKDLPEDPYETLTVREREVLYLTAEGMISAEIAARLSISSRTAETHRANMMRKLGMRTQTDLIRYALRRGILPMDI